MKEKSYTTAEICEMFDISKSTLFRLEREGILLPVPRDITGQRQYGKDHLRQINEKQRESFGRRYQQIANQVNQDENAFWQLYEVQAIREFLEDDLTGLHELAESPQLSGAGIQQLLKIALDRYQPEDEVFREIISVIWHHLELAEEPEP